MTVSYCEKWFDPGKRPIKPLDVDEARRRHEARQPYTALIGGQDKPSHVISLAGKWVSVGFMDDSQREYMVYDFNEKKPGRLFLTMATHREFEGDGEDPVMFAQLSFQENGHVIIERRDLRSNTVAESERDVDVSANLEPYPEFGEYTALCRKERELRGGN